MSRPLRILQIDDDLGMNLTMADILKKLGYEVETACCGEQGLMKLPHGFDCVICDVVMPGMNGLEFRKKTVEMLGDIPFIFVTAYVEPEIQQEINTLEGVGYLEKPIKIPLLLETLNMVLAAPKPDKAFIHEA